MLKRKLLRSLSGAEPIVRHNYGFDPATGLLAVLEIWSPTKSAEVKQEKEEKHQKGRKAKVTELKRVLLFWEGKKSEKPWNQRRACM